MSRNLVALVLAAGASTRLGQPKQLVLYHGERLVDRAARIAADAGASLVFVVLGAEVDSVLQGLQQSETLRVLIHKGWAAGMAGAIALGAAAAERAGADDLLVLACDQPAVDAEHLRTLVEVSRREHVVASVYSGRRGIPALFPSFALHALQGLQGDRGARDLLQREDVMTVPLADGEFDVDTPEDLQKLRAVEAQNRGQLSPL